MGIGKQIPSQSLGPVGAQAITKGGLKEAWKRRRKEPREVKGPGIAGQPVAAGGPT